MEMGRTTGSVIFPVSDLTDRNLHPVLIYAYDNEQSNKSRVAIFSQRKELALTGGVSTTTGAVSYRLADR